MCFFISDTHFGHHNILGYDERPFKDTGEMDAELIGRWNAAVYDTDDVYILGDFIWTSDKNHAAEIVASLSGRKHLIVGNHDQVFTRNKKFFLEDEELLDEIVEYKELFIEATNSHIVLCHYPMPFFKNIFHGWYHFYGHVHNTPEWYCCEQLRKSSSEYYKSAARMLNVGCMMKYMDYAPKSFTALDKELQSMYADCPNLSYSKPSEKKTKGA